MFKYDNYYDSYLLIKLNGLKIIRNLNKQIFSIT